MSETATASVVFSSCSSRVALAGDDSQTKKSSSQVARLQDDKSQSLASTVIQSPAKLSRLFRPVRQPQFRLIANDLQLSAINHFAVPIEIKFRFIQTALGLCLRVMFVSCETVARLRDMEKSLHLAPTVVNQGTKIKTKKKPFSLSLLVNCPSFRVSKSYAFTERSASDSLCDSLATCGKRVFTDSVNSLIN